MSEAKKQANTNHENEDILNPDELAAIEEMKALFDSYNTKYKLTIKPARVIPSPLFGIQNIIENNFKVVEESFTHLEDALKYKEEFLRARNLIKMEGIEKEPLEIKIRSITIEGLKTITKVLQSDGTWCPESN